MNMNLQFATFLELQCCSFKKSQRFPATLTNHLVTNVTKRPQLMRSEWTRRIFDSVRDYYEAYHHNLPVCCLLLPTGLASLGTCISSCLQAWPS